MSMCVLADYDTAKSIDHIGRRILRMKLRKKNAVDDEEEGEKEKGNKREQDVTCSQISDRQTRTSNVVVDSAKGIIFSQSRR